MILFKNIKFFIYLLILLFVILLFGLKKLLLCLIALVGGFVVARFTLSSNLPRTNFMMINKKKLGDREYFAQEFKYLKSLKKSKSSNMKSSSSSSSIVSLLNESSKKSKGVSSTAPNSNNTRSKNNDQNLDLGFFFRHNYPWQSLYIEENVDKSIEEFLSLIIQEFILSWYSKISKDDGLIFELKILFRHILANFILRLKQVDRNYFFIMKFNTLLYNHLSDFSEFYKNHAEQFNLSRTSLSANKRIEKQFEIFKLIMKKNPDKCIHFALTSRENEIVYLKKMCKQVLTFLLPDYILKCRESYDIIEEITVSNLLFPMLDSIAKPTTINKLIFNILDPSPSTIKVNTDERINVQLLKHWSQMNGFIFRPIQTPSLKDIVDNNENLHVFINYLTSLNSLSVLQFYLMTRDILKTYTDEASNISNCPNVSCQIEELKAWCKNNSKFLSSISFDSNTSYYSKLSNIINKDAAVIDHNQTQHILGEIHRELFNLIKDTYYLTFIKSEYIYKNLFGIQKPALGSGKSTGGAVTKAPTSEVRSDSESYLVEDSLSNTEIDLDDMDYKSNEAEPAPYFNARSEMADNDMEDEEENSDRFDFENDENQHEFPTIKPNGDVRIDLIDEIKDELSDEEMAIVEKTHSTPMLTRQETVISQEQANASMSFEEEDEDEQDFYQSHQNDELSNFNLSNFRISIDEIEEIVDKTNKTSCAFVIQVWNIDSKSGDKNTTNQSLSSTNASSKTNKDDAKLSSGSLSECESWVVKRKYDEFYVLDNKLKEFHGVQMGNSQYNSKNSNQITTQLPSKQRALFFINRDNNVEYLNSVKADFQKYLQNLLSNPILSKSQLIISFLVPNRKDFNSSIFNNITSIGKMVKGVPYKLRVERGQSLNSFLIYLFKSVKNPKSKPSNNPISFEDITEKQLNDADYSNSEKNKAMLKKSSSEIMSDKKLATFLVTPFVSLTFLINEIFKLPRMLRIILFSLHRVVNGFVDYLIYWYLSHKITELTSPERIQRLIVLLKDVVFSKDPPPDVDHHTAALNSMNKFLSDNRLSEMATKLSITSPEELNEIIDNGSFLFLESFQYPILNKNLSYRLLDALIQELFPELDDYNNK